jgi:hypothetical protein
LQIQKNQGLHGEVFIEKKRRYRRQRRSGKKSKGQDLVRQSISTNVWSDLNWNDVKAQLLLTNVKSLEFSFWDERLKSLLLSLQDLNENKNTIRTMKMELVWIDENNHDQKIEKTYRIMYPYYNPKVDDLKGGAYGENPPPAGTFPDPEDPNSQSGGANGGGGGVHF